MFYAALDAAALFVVGTGYSRREATVTLSRFHPGQYCVVPCTPAAFRFLRGHGCSPHPAIIATPDGVRMVDEMRGEQCDELDELSEVLAEITEEHAVDNIEVLFAEPEEVS